MHLFYDKRYAVVQNDLCGLLPGFLPGGEHGFRLAGSGGYGLCQHFRSDSGHLLCGYEGCHRHVLRRQVPAQDPLNVLGRDFPDVFHILLFVFRVTQNGFVVPELARYPAHRLSGVDEVALDVELRHFKLIELGPEPLEPLYLFDGGGDGGVDVPGLQRRRYEEEPRVLERHGVCGYAMHQLLVYLYPLDEP